MPTMQTRNPVSSANLMGHPLHPILITLPIGLFAGLIGAALAAVTGLIDFLGDRRIRAACHRQRHPGADPALQFLSALSLRDERRRAARAEPLAHRRSRHAVHRLERRRMIPPPGSGEARLAG